MRLTFSIDGPSNAGKSTVVAELARRGLQVLPDAGDLFTIFPPFPVDAVSARANERYCVLAELARSALLGTRWRQDTDCVMDRSALSTLAIAYGYSGRFGAAAFGELCGELAGAVRSGTLRMPGTFVYLSRPAGLLSARNAQRPIPLDDYWMEDRMLQRQLDFYEAWADLVGPSCLVVAETDRPAAVLADQILLAVRTTPAAAAGPVAAALEALPERLQNIQYSARRSS
ncbi:hypothetical protein OG474_45435 [Kribbella sp. NBC_01505]|uniref:hypothetical protein n=1 Tax=Kribbella sp. NBC_01505 TaxID=2903580 RepID=UPI00386FDC2B